MKFSLKDLGKQLNVLLFLLPGLFAFTQNRPDLGVIFIFIALLLEGSLLPQLKTLPWGKPWLVLSNGFLKSTALKNALIWFMWIGLSLTTLTFETFGWAFPRPDWFPLGPKVWLQGMFFIGLVASVWVGETRDGKEKPTVDTSVWVARVWFWLVFALAVGMRIYKMNSPEGSYGFDEAGGVMETRLVRDMQNYRQGFYIAYYQKPIFCYISLFFWHFLPNATDLFIVRLSAMVCDLGTVWLLYLAGKEVGGRRAGLLAMALGAISKPEMILSAMGMGAVMVPFFMLLPLLIALRLFKKPGLKHFIELGLALAPGIYNNDYIRVEILFFIAIIFVWLLLKKENRTLKGPMGAIVGINGLVLAFYCYFMSFGFVGSSWVNHLFQDRQMECFIFMFSCFFFLGLMTFALGPGSNDVKKNRGWIDALLGLWACILLDYPMMTRADSLERLDSMVRRGNGLMPALNHYWERIISAIDLLFWTGTSPANMGLMGESYFSYIEVIVIFLGLAFFIVKPNWPKIFVFAVGAVGILPHALAEGTHNARVADSIGPFLLLGGLGLNELLKKHLQFKTEWVYKSLIALLVVFWAWCSWTTYYRVYGVWFDKQILYFTGARNVVEQETALGNRVYFCDDIFSVEATVVNEGFVIHRAYPVNVIYRNPNDKPQDITLIAHDFSSVEGKTLQLEVAKYFSKVVWEHGREVVYCRIPAVDLNDKKQKMFVFKDEPKDVWKREYIRNECGLIFDLLYYEDRVANIHDPVSPDFDKTHQENIHQWLEAVRYSATIHVAQGGDYLLHYKATNRSWLKIDGKMAVDLSFFQLQNRADLPVIYWAPAKEGDEKVHLTPGDHQVEVVTAFQRSFDPPEFWLRPEGAPAPGTSLWNSFAF